MSLLWNSWNTNLTTAQRDACSWSASYYKHLKDQEVMFYQLNTYLHISQSTVILITYVIRYLRRVTLTSICCVLRWEKSVTASYIICIAVTFILVYDTVTLHICSH